MAEPADRTKSGNVSEESKIRLLSFDDFPFAQTVRKIAGWNQTDTDWRRLVEHAPEGCFLIEHDGKPAGTATTTSYGTDLAWIGMVLVHPEFRRLGLATALLNHCLNYLLVEKKVRCVKLDATPDGQKVYEKLGFQVEYGLARWERNSEPFDENPNRGQIEIPSYKLDHIAFGADRSKFLDQMLQNSSRSISIDECFGTIREGMSAAYLGPVISDDRKIGERIISDLISTSPSSHIFWDIFDDNPDAIRLAESLGFIKQRKLIRMWTGDSNLADRPEFQWAIGGPETG
ncbi:GNAT family N-acetyltransferase [Verrucomicrobiales bacterium]|nr:GNAT family N-acetyltransferase [Verrucomicrobiales bacterium]MDC0322925.1 GNAT family N-acetyltransferase [Verrucomicrobiales bacterium]